MSCKNFLTVKIFNMCFSFEIILLSAYSAGEELHEVVHSPEHITHSHQPKLQDLMGVHWPKVFCRVLSRPHRHHACNAKLAVPLSIKLLDGCECRFTRVVGKYPTINIVVTFSEVHGGSRGVASNLPDGFCKLRRLQISIIILVTKDTMLLIVVQLFRWE